LLNLDFYWRKSTLINNFYYSFHLMNNSWALIIWGCIIVGIYLMFYWWNISWKHRDKETEKHSYNSLDEKKSDITATLKEKNKETGNEVVVNNKLTSHEEENNHIQKKETTIDLLQSTINDKKGKQDARKFFCFLWALILIGVIIGNRSSIWEILLWILVAIRFIIKRPLIIIWWLGLLYLIVRIIKMAWRD